MHDRQPLPHVRLVRSRRSAHAGPQRGHRSRGAPGHDRRRDPAAADLAPHGFTLVEVREGFAVFECEPAEFHYNPIGAVHGGLACTLLDSALGCAGHTTLAAGVGYTSVDLNVRYLRPITHASGLLRATGRVVKPGRRVIFTEGELTDAAGRVVASATSSLLVLAPTASRAERPPGLRGSAGLGSGHGYRTTARRTPRRAAPSAGDPDSTSSSFPTARPSSSTIARVPPRTRATTTGRPKPSSGSSRRPRHRPRYAIRHVTAAGRSLFRARSIRRGRAEVRRRRRHAASRLDALPGIASVGIPNCASSTLGTSTPPSSPSRARGTPCAAAPAVPTRAGTSRARALAMAASNSAGRSATDDEVVPAAVRAASRR